MVTSYNEILAFFSTVSTWLSHSFSSSRIHRQRVWEAVPYVVQKDCTLVVEIQVLIDL